MDCMNIIIKVKRGLVNCHKIISSFMIYGLLEFKKYRRQEHVEYIIEGILIIFTNNIN